MKTEVKLIDLGMNAMRLTKNGRLTKIDKDGDDWNSSNFADKGEFTIRLDLFIAEDSGDAYSIPAKSATVTLGFDKVTEIADFIQPTAGTAVGTLRYTDAERALDVLRVSVEDNVGKGLTHEEVQLIYRALKQEMTRE